MKVLMISTDRKIFEEDSAVRQRILEYGKMVDELKIMIFNSSNKAPQDLKIPNSNVALYSTNSINRWFYVFDAIRVGIKVVRNWKLEIRNLSNKNEILVTCQDPFETGLVGWFIARKFKTKLQLQVHTDFLSKYFSKESFLNRIRVVIAKFLLPKADGVRVVSGRIKRSIIGRNLVRDKNKIKVLPIFVDLEKIKNIQPTPGFQQEYSKFDFVFLVASRLEKEKNVDLIIKSFSEVVKKHPKSGLVIVGEGSLRARLEQQVASLRLQNSVIFKGWQNDLIEYYKSFGLFVSASYYEGFGMSLVEAGISGCPILTTKVGIVGEILDEYNSLVCDVNDENCFIEKMIYAIENKEKLKEMNEIAQREIELNLINDKQKYLEEYIKTWSGV